MQHIFNRACMVLSALCLITTTPVSGSWFEDHKKSQMIKDLEVIKHHFDAGYAPSIWKKECMGWDLEQSFETAKDHILSTPSITTKQFQRIVRHFINSMKDHHVDVVFFSTESASLPFSVKGVNGKYFINWIDKLRLPFSHYDISVGDELIEFDGQPIAKVIEDLRKENEKSANSETDQTLAEIKLTQRIGMQGDIVPKGSVVVTIESHYTGKRNGYQLHWSYIPERIKNPFDFSPPLDFIPGLIPGKGYLDLEETLQLSNIKMVSPLHEVYMEKYALHEGELGARKSFVPLLGEVIWTTEEEKSSYFDKTVFDEDGIDWHAYIYRHSNEKAVGYIRIPHYLGRTADAKKFGEILDFMEENTNALVIDQVHNFGGFVDFQYQLVSMLVTKQPFTTPLHRVKITQKQVFEGYKILEFIHLIELTLQQEANDDFNFEVEKKENSLGVNYQRLLFVKTYYENLLEDWNQGYTLTRPTSILGIDYINPHPVYHYSKPVLMLINEMDFSGGDFVPAILQDNQRVVLFGSRTAGAGGFVDAFEFPNAHGIALCTYTASIAERANSQKIENLGVTPDIIYQLTVEDLQQGYQKYADAVNEAVSNLWDSQK